MKFFILLFSILLLSFQNSQSSDCFQGDTLFFHSQADIDMYGETYNDCTDLDASIVIDPVDSEINSLVPLENIESISGVLIIRNTNLVRFTGLHNINNVGFGVLIFNNNSIIGLTGLNGLDKIGEVSESHIDEVGFLRIESNDNLLNLWGVDNLDEITGDLIITNNNSLFSLDGLEALREIKGQKFTGEKLVNSEINIYNNKKLFKCSVLGICALKDYTNFIFKDNMSGCNSIVEVQNGCSFISVEEYEDSEFNIYPNPTENLFTINPENEINDIVLMNIMGKVIYKSNNTKAIEFNLTNEPSGVYYISINGKVSKILKK